MKQCHREAFPEAALCACPGYKTRRLHGPVKHSATGENSRAAAEALPGLQNPPDL
ncbi:hypothetical protein [Klebsiella pasteurii]|uniref:hypothetical protein n=1 Tax=Klebsiella pasteurii TaxID=2587529 RepID=UPI00237A8E7F|nr:hypothetical protein [Klebsiella pasteurii]MDD9652396.1 hypothetical protein [Klebsiella pasteurii]